MSVVAAPAPASAPRLQARPGGPLTGTGELLRLALRRDRVRLPLVVAILVLLMTATASAMAGSYPTAQDRAALAATVDTNTAFLALLGPARHPESLGAMTAWRIGAFLALVVAILGATTVVRHTRKEEESGRLELVGALRVGRLAAFAAGLLAALGLVVVSSFAVAVPVLGQGGLGALAFAFQNLVAGLAGVAVGIVGAQVATVSRVASSLAVSALVGTYALRAAADVQDSLAWMSWLSPMGWGQRIDPFGEDRLALVLLGVAVLVVGVAVAARLATRRDLGAGLVTDRSGPAGAPGLRNLPTLAWRLQRPVLVTWAAPVAAYTFLVGLLLESVGDIAGTSPQASQIIEQMGGAGVLKDAFVVAIMGFVGLAVGAHVVASLGRLHTDETSGRAELLLSRSVSRTSYLLVHVLVVAVGVVLLPLAAGVAMGIGHAVAGGTWGAPFWQVVGAGLLQVPAVLVVVGFMALVYGWWPRLVMLGWALVVGSLVVGQLGELFGLPTWVQDLSPFAHVPSYPIDDVTVTPLLVLTVIAVALTAVGVVGFRRRDVVA